MTELPTEVWKKVLAFARPAPVMLPVYPSSWRRAWPHEALAAIEAWQAAGRQDLTLALVFHSYAILRTLMMQEERVYYYRRYIRQYSDYLNLHFTGIAVDGLPLFSCDLGDIEPMWYRDEMAFFAPPDLPSPYKKEGCSE
jgi:hypothetical protein